MEELYKIIKKKYKDFEITSQHLGQVIRDNNITRKRTRHERWIKNLRFFIHPTFNKIKQSFILLNEHYPKERYGKPTDIKKELKAFYKEIGKYSLNKIISLDETSIKPAMYLPYTPKTNPIEQYFNQIKHYLKLNKKVLKYDELVVEIKNAIKQVKKENYKNYFENAYNKDAYKDYVKKDSTLKRKPKNYKD